MIVNLFLMIHITSILNGQITENEILQAVSKLKNNKAPGYDKLCNEYICTSVSCVLPLYVDFFNLIYDSGIVPEEWLIGIIKPIYKNKGDPTLPENYRPITLLSCLGKLFTSILCERLNIFSESVELITEAQTGFRKVYSTVDNILLLNFLCKFMISSKKKTLLRFHRLQTSF